MLKWRMAEVAVLVLVSSLIGVQAGVAPVQKTGQTSTFLTGDDGDLQAGVALASPRFTDNGDDTITDNHTGLMWRKAAAVWGLINWNTAIDNCDALSLGGHTDWRLPTINEIQSLVDYEEAHPPLPVGYPFTGVHSAGYWTSTTDPNTTGNAFEQSLWATATPTTAKTLTRNALPVRGVSTTVGKTGQTTSYRTGDDGDLEPGVEWPSPRFTDNGDTITDNLTTLMWAEDTNADGTKNLTDAIAYCNALSLGGHSDWRLPNLKELQSLLDYGQTSPCLPVGHPFVPADTVLYWTSTTLIWNTDYAWRMSAGVVNFSTKVTALTVWPVRGEFTAPVALSPGTLIYGK